MENQLDRWVSSRSLSPFRSFFQAQEPFDRFLNEIANSNMKMGAQELYSCPVSELADEGNSYSIKVDLPGVMKDHVKVEANGDVLTIHAERREEKKTDTKRKYLSETYYGSYDRSFTLPGPIDEKKVDAKFENGVLTVTVPKTETLKAKQISIR